MRTCLLPIVLFALVAGCESTATTATSKEVAELREQVALLQAKLDKLPDQPVILALNPDGTLDPRFHPRYRLAAGTVPGRPNMDAIYILDTISGRMIVAMFHGSSEKLELIAGREFKNDLKGLSVRTTALPPSPADSVPNGSNNVFAAPRSAGNFITVRCAADEHALVVADDASEKLLIYKLDYTRKRLEFVGQEDLAKHFKIMKGPSATVAAPARPLPAPPPPAPTGPPPPDIPLAPLPKPGPPPF